MRSRRGLRLAGCGWPRERGLRLGVGHNFLFSEPTNGCGAICSSGVLGRIDDVIITWHRPLPQAVHGPFDTWMLRDPRNILIEIGSHSVAHMLDLVGEPEEVRGSSFEPHGSAHRPEVLSPLAGERDARAKRRSSCASPLFLGLPNTRFMCAVRWLPPRWTLSATPIRSHEHRPSDPDFENYSMLVSQAKSLKRQARRTLRNYVESKLHLRARGNPYGESIARAMDAFYDPRCLPLDARIDGHTGATVIRLCEAMGALADLPPEDVAPRVRPLRPVPLNRRASLYWAARALSARNWSGS